MQRQHFVSTCTHKQQIAASIYEVRFTKPEGFTFEAGQYVFWSVPLVSNTTDLQNRAYSIASAPHESELRFIIKVLPTGRASDFVREQLLVGTTVPMYGPFGVFTLIPDTASAIFIATSTGIAPYLSMIEQNLCTKSGLNIHVLLSFSTVEEIFYQEYLEQFAKRDPHFTFTVTVTKPSVHWQGKTGRVQTHLQSLLQRYPDAAVYVCGNPAMVADVKQLLFGEFGLSKERVKLEGYV